MAALFGHRPDLQCKPEDAKHITPNNDHLLQRARRKMSHQDTSHLRNSPNFGENFDMDTAHFTREVLPGHTKYSQHFVCQACNAQFVFPLTRLRTEDFVDCIVMFVRMISLRYGKKVKCIASDAFSSFTENHKMLELRMKEDFVARIYPPHRHNNNRAESAIRHCKDGALIRIQNLKGFKIGNKLVDPYRFMIYAMVHYTQCANQVPIPKFHIA